MKPYSEDLRARIVKAVEDGMSKSAAARLFDISLSSISLSSISLSSVKRYARMANRGTSLAPRKGAGRPPKTDESTRRLLKEDVKERPAATLSERRRFLQSAAGKSLSTSTVRRLLKKMGFSQKRTVGLWNEMRG
jgi:transposase